MILNDDEKQYEDVMKILKQLPKVNAPMRFEADLMRKINSETYQSAKKLSFWERFLAPARLIPSAGFAVAAIIVLFVIDTSSVELDDPLSVEPRVREDMIQSSSNAGVSLDEMLKGEKSLSEQSIARVEGDDLLKRKSPATNQRRPEADATERASSGMPSATFTTASSINKNGLNFRQVNLTQEERRELKRLKEKNRQVLEQQATGSGQ